MTTIPLRFVPLLALLSLVASVAAPQGATPTTPPAEPWFSVTISTPNASVRAGSDVKLNIVLANTTGKDLHSGYGGPGRDGPVFDIDIRDSRNVAVPETPFGLTLHGKNPHPFAGSVFSAPSHPGEPIKEELILSKEYDLSKPGKYTRTGAGTAPGFSDCKIKRYYDYSPSSKPLKFCELTRTGRYTQVPRGRHDECNVTPTMLLKRRQPSRFH